MLPQPGPYGAQIGPRPRRICDVARDIRAAWPKPYFGAVPYLEAMARLEGPRDMFGADSARSIVLYFLSNASTFRGEKARALKAELKGLINAG